MNYIYKITNLINNKIYIGKTRYTIPTRWSQHVSASLGDNNKVDYNFLLHQAIRKYGEKNFKIEKLEEVEEARAYEREIYWIEKYNSCVLKENGYGYNMTFGGEGSPKIDKNKIFNLWKEGKGSKEISTLLNCSSVSTRKILETYTDYDKEMDYARNTTNIKVYQYDNNGVLLRSFPSISYAAKQVGVDPSCISRCCNKQKNSAKGFFWSFSDNEIFEKKTLKTWNKIQVAQLSLNGELISTYDSLSAAGRAMNKKQTKYIKECCEGKRENMYGYKWKFVEAKVNGEHNNR